MIVGVTGDRPLQKRLYDMGLMVGQEVTVIQRQGAGAMVAAVGDTRLALGLAVTQKVLVTPIMDEVKL